jgi:hypothetical protein
MSAQFQIGGPCPKCGMPNIQHPNGQCPPGVSMMIRGAAQQAPDAVPYGIIDPDYARIFTVARCWAWSQGYAIAMHGSFTRDLDLIAIPWTDAACPAEQLAKLIADSADMRLASGPGNKPHGRLAWTLMFKTFSDPRFVDLSVMPRATTGKDGRDGN